jgi:AraC family transcriptional regulator of adaptative response / DNA-3-methyladenine glycosylase II
MREVFRSTPRELRERRRRTDRLAADGGLVLRMPLTPPYDWDAMLAFLTAHAIPGVESVVDGTYRRTIALDGDPGLLELTVGGADHLLLRAHLPYWEGVIHVVERAAQLVGLDTEPVLAAAQLGGDSVIGPLVRARPGLRVPGAWGPFELAVQAIVRDQAPAEANEILAHLVSTAGTPVAGLRHELTHAFPSAEALIAQYDGAGRLGETLRGLAQEVACGNLKLDGAEPLESLVQSLTRIDGITEVAAHHVALRLGARDAFPAEVTPESEAWRPWRALAYLHLTQ